MSFRIWIDRPAPADLVIADDVELVPDRADADGAVIGADEHWDAETCQALPRLKVLARAGIGFDNVDPTSCASVGVASCNAPDAPTVSTAEHTLALLLTVAKNITQSADKLREGHSEYRSRHNAIELDGLTLGLLGIGRIGKRVAHYATAFGMKVIAHDPGVNAVGEVELVELADLWTRSQVISLHAPAVPATHHIINADTLAQMPKGVIIVNCARGSLINQDALLDALESGQVGGAGLDVTDPEPLPPDHPLLNRFDVVVTPHVASSTTVGVTRLISDALDQALCWLRGATPEHLLAEVVADVDRRNL